MKPDFRVLIHKVEDGSNMFLRKVGTRLPDYVVPLQKPENHNMNQFDNLKYRHEEGDITCIE
jgi:hypothetical protein